MRGRALVICTMFGASWANLASAEAPPKPVGPILDMRLRHEFADQANLNEEASATTLRLRAGYEAAVTKNLLALGEIEGVAHLGAEEFNNTFNGRTQYPVVADPDGLEINRLQVSYLGLPDTRMTLGRQRIVLDNARFIGAAGFRQNEQTFDAIRLQTSVIKPIAIDYAYVARVLRIFGPDSPKDDFNGDTHLLNVAATTGFGRLSGYGYWLDLEEAPEMSSATYGVRLARPVKGKQDWRFGYSVEYARQSEHGSARVAYRSDYLHGEAIVAHGPWTVNLGGEYLGGDGVRAFQTPLATLHAYQGAADVFLVTPANGLRDVYLRGAWTTEKLPAVKSTKFTVSIHDFTSDGGEALGQEIDAIARAAINPRWSMEVKGAYFDGAARGPSDITRLWATIEYKF